MSKKILVFTTYYPDSELEVFKEQTAAVHYFCKEWAKLGFEVYVCHLRMRFGLIFENSFVPKVKSIDQLDGVNIIRIDITRVIPKSNKLMPFQVNKIIEGLEYILKNKGFEPKYILAHFPLSYSDILFSFYRKNRKTIKVLTFHNSDLNYLKRTGNSNLESIIEEFSPKLLFRSKRIQETYEDMYPKMLIEDENEEKIIYSGSPIHLEHLPKKQKDSFLYVGKLVESKNIHIILEALAAKKDKEFVFNIIGEGEYKSKLIEITKQFGINDKVNFLGQKERIEVLDYMKHSEYFVMVSSNETFGIVYVEALAMGCITIGSKGEGIDGVIVNGKNGFLVRARRCGIFKSFIRELFMSDELFLTEIKNQALSTGKYFSESNMASNYLEKFIVDKKV